MSDILAASTSDIVSQFIRKQGEVGDLPEEPRVIGDGKYRLRWRQGQPPPTPAALQLPLGGGLSDNLAEYKPSYEPEYKPEKVVYICSDPDNCPRGRRPVPYFRGQYKPKEPELPPPPPVIAENPAFIPAPEPPVLIAEPPSFVPQAPSSDIDFGLSLEPQAEPIPQNIETPLVIGGDSANSPEFTPQIIEIQTEPQDNLRPQVVRPGQPQPDDVLFDSRPQRIEDTTPNDEELNSNTILRQRPRPNNGIGDEQRPLLDNINNNNEVGDNDEVGVSGGGGGNPIIRQRPRIKIQQTTTEATTTTTIRTTTTTVASRVTDDVSTTEIIVEDFSNFKRARGTTPSPNSKPPSSLRIFPAVPGLSPDDINSMSKSELMEMVRAAADPNVPELLSSNVIEMIMEVIKRTGKEFTEDDVEVIADASKQAGENLGKGLIRVVATMSEAMGPVITDAELKAITKTANLFEAEDASLQTVEVVAAVAAKVGPNPSPEDLDMVVKVVASQQNGLAESGFSLKESKRMSKLLSDLGDDVTPEELQLIKEVTKELIPDLPDQKVELVSMMLKELGPEIEPQMIQTIAAAAREPDVTLSGHDVEVIAEMAKDLGTQLAQEQLEAVADLFSRSNFLTESVMRDVAEKSQGLGLDLEPHDVKIIADIVNMMGSEKSSGDMEIAALLTSLAGDKDTNSPPETSQTKPEVSKNVPEVSEHASQILSNMVNALNEENNSPADVKAVMEMAKAAVPELTSQQAEIVTTVLVEISGNVTPDIVQETVEIAAEVTPDLTPRKIEKLVQMANEISGEVTAEQVQAVVDLVEKMGPSVSASEVQRMSNVDLPIGDIQTVLEIQQESGKKLSEAEVQVVALVSKSADSSLDGVDSGLSFIESNEIAKFVQKMGPEVSPSETNAIEKMLKAKDPSLTEDQAELFANFLTQLAPKVAPKIVEEISEIVKDIQTEMTDSDIAKLAEMTKQLTHEVTPQQVDIVAEMSSKMSPVLSHRDMQMIARMAKKAGESLSMNDVHVLAEVTKILGPEVTKEEAEIAALFSKLANSEATTLFREETEQAPVGSFPTASTTPPTPSEPAGISVDEAEVITQMLGQMESGMTEGELQVIEGVVLQMDPSLRPDQAETFAAILKEMGETAKSPEVVQEISVAVKQVEADLNIELIAELAAEVSREMSPQDIRLVAEMAQQMGPDLSAGEVQMISKMAPDLEMHDVEMIAEILKSVEGQPREGEIEVIALLTKTASLRADDAMTLDEAAELANMVNDMGPNLDSKSVAKIESLAKTMDRELSSTEAKIVASMLQVLEGPALTPETVQKAAEVAKDVEPDVTPEVVKNIAILVRGLSTEVSSQKLEVVAEMSKQMGPELSPGEVQMISRMVSNSGLGSISTQDVKILSEITNVVGGPPSLTPAKTEMIALLTKKANEENAESSSSPSAGRESATIETAAVKIMEVLHASSGPSISPREKTEVKALVKSIESSLSSDEAEVAVLFIEHLMPKIDVEMIKVATDAAKSANIKPSDVQTIARMAKELSKEVGVEVVDLVAEVTGQMGPDLTRNEIHLMTQMAKNADSDIKEKDVQILSDIAKVIGPQPAPEVVKVVAMLSQSGESDSTPSLLSKQGCEKLSQMVSHLGANGGAAAAQQGVREVEDVVFQAAPELSSNQVKVMAQMLVELSGNPIGPATVEKVAELVKDANPKLTPAKVKSISEMAGSLSKEIAPSGIELVSSMVQKMGPVLSHRETQMISRMAARSGVELTMSDIHVLSDITNSVGNDLTTNDIEIISVLTKKAGDSDAVDVSSQLKTTPNVVKEDSRLSMVVRMKKPTERPSRPETAADDESSPEIDAASNFDFGVKENRNKNRKQPQPIQFTNFGPKDAENPVTAFTASGPESSTPSFGNQLRVRRPPATTTTTTVAPAQTEEDFQKTSDARRRRPVPLRLAPVRGFTTQQQEEEQEEFQPEVIFSTTTQPTTTMTTTTTTTTTTETTTTFSTTTTTEPTTTTSRSTSRARPTPKSQRFSSPSDAATMLNNALGNPVGNSFMQFFMGNKELNNFSFNKDVKPAITTTASPTINFAANPEIPSGISSGEEIFKSEQLPIDTPRIQPPDSNNNFMKFVMGGGSGQDSSKQFEKLTITEPEITTTTTTAAPLPSFDRFPTTFGAPETGNQFFTTGSQESDVSKSEFPDFATMLNKAPTDPSFTPGPPQDLTQFRGIQSDVNPPSGQPVQLNPGKNPLVNFLLKTNLKDPGATSLPTSFEPFVRETTTLDRTPSGNFMQILMGRQRLSGVDETSNQLLKKLEKKKIPLDQSGDNFMAFGIGDQLERRTIGDVDNVDERYDDEDADTFESNQNQQFYEQEEEEEDPWPVTRPTPFTVRPTLPVGQVVQPTLPTRTRTWSTPEPFTVRPTKKSSKHRSKSTTTYSPPRLPVEPYSDERPELKDIPFTVRPKSNPYGSTVLDHDVKLKSPFEDSIHNFGGKFNGDNGKHPDKPAHSSYNVQESDLPQVTAADQDYSLDYNLDGGYKGLPNFNFPGVHDDRPDYAGTPAVGGKPPAVGKLQEHFHSLSSKGKKKKPAVVDAEAEFEDYSSGDASFGDLKFNLPNDGSFPDQPEHTLSDSMLRDLPDMGIHPNYPSTEDTLVDLKDLYLKNPFGNDFIRLEVDAERFRHNKTASGGIHHIPLIINGYPDIVKKTNRNDDDSKTKNIERKNGESKPKNVNNRNSGEGKPKNVNSRDSKPKPPHRNADQTRPKSVNRIGDLKPKNSNNNRQQSPPESKPKNVLNRNGEPKPKQASQPEPQQHNRRKLKAPPPAPVKKVTSHRSQPPPTAPATAPPATTKTPFATQVRDRFPGFMQSLTNSWANRAWDLGAAAA